MSTSTVLNVNSYYISVVAHNESHEHSAIFVVAAIHLSTQSFEYFSIQTLEIEGGPLAYPFYLLTVALWMNNLIELPIC